MAQPKKHISNAAINSPARQPAVPFQPVVKSTKAQAAEGQLALFIAEHTAVATCDHLCELCKRCFKDSSVASHIQIRRSKCSAAVVLCKTFYIHISSQIWGQLLERIITVFCWTILSFEKDDWQAAAGSKRWKGSSSFCKVWARSGSPFNITAWLSSIVFSIYLIISLSLTLV